MHEPTERFERVNPAFATILGRDPDDLVGVAVADVTHPEDRHLQPDLSGGSSAKLRKRFLRPSGRAVWVEVSYTVVRDAAGVPSQVIKQIQDLDTIKESERALLDALEQQRAATASLRELDRIRTDLVGTISHELRTPLTSVRGYLELLDAEPLTETQHGMLEVALRNSERLSDLVDNLLGARAARLCRVAEHVQQHRSRTSPASWPAPSTPSVPPSPSVVRNCRSTCPTTRPWCAVTASSSTACW